MAQSSTKFVLRPFDRLKDYKEYSSWWTNAGDVAPSLGDLPPLGLVVGDMKAVAFLAMTDTDITILTFWHCNPKNTPKESYISLHLAVSGIMDLAQHTGRSKVFCYTNIRGMIRVLESQGFNNYDGHLIAEVL